MTNRLHLTLIDWQWMPGSIKDTDFKTNSCPGGEECRSFTTPPGKNGGTHVLYSHPWCRRRASNNSPIFPFCCYAVSRVLCIKPLLIKCWSTRKAKAFPPDLPVQPNRESHEFTWKSENTASTLLSNGLSKENRHLLAYSLCRERALLISVQL